MNVVWHQAIADDGRPRALGRRADQIQIEPVVAVLEKHALAPIAALSNMVRGLRNDDAGEASHRVLPAAESLALTGGNGFIQRHRNSPLELLYP
jgi:hypothetical protein